jgi:hypothetical protein
MLSILKMIGSTNITVTELGRLLTNLHTTEIACNPERDSLLTKINTIHPPKVLAGSLFALSVAEVRIWASTFNMHVLQDLQSMAQAIEANTKTRTKEIGYTLQLGSDIATADKFATTIRNSFARIAHALGVVGFNDINLVQWKHG